MWLMMTNKLWGDGGSSPKSTFSLTLNQTRWWMENDFLNWLWPFRVHSDAILTHKCPNGLPTHYEQHFSSIHRLIHCGITRRHLDLLQKSSGIIWACSSSFSPDPSTWANCQKREVCIRSHINWVPWVCHLACWY